MPGGGQTILAANALTAGLRADFAATYRQQYRFVRERLARIMMLGVPSDKLTELYAYFESAPYPIRWPRGQTISSKPFKSVQFSVTNVDWARKIEWHKNDREDDQIRSLFDQARQLGANFATLHERVFFQLLTNTTDSTLLATIPNAPDGAAFFATTAAGANRFGVSGGNIVTGTGVATSGAVRTDFFSAISRFKRFQDTEGQPLLEEGVLDQGISVIYGATNEQIFREAFIQSRTVQATAAGQASTGAAVTNIVLESGLNLKLWSTQRITDNDWFIILEGTQIKPVFQQEREALKEHVETMDNSDYARRTKIESIQWDARYGYGINIPYSAIKVDN